MSLYMAEAELLAELKLAVWQVLVLVHVLQEVWLQGRWEWMRKIGVDHNIEVEEVLSSPPVRWQLFKAAPLAPLMAAATPFGEEDPFVIPPGWNCDPLSPVSPLLAYSSNIN